MRVGAKDIEQLLHPMIDYEAINDVEDVLLNRSQGTGASPGGGVGRAVFDKETAIEYAARGEKVVLCRIETNPSDYAGMIVAQAIATSRGGETSHAALVAGNKGIPCVVGTGIEIDEENKRIIYSTDDGQKKVINEGDWLSVDGSTGKVLSHKAELSEPRIDDPDLQNFLTLLKENTKVRVYANANDAQEAKRALLFGAEGIGLARTEYMFLEDKMENEHRALTIQSWVVAEDDAVKEQALHKLEEMQKRDFLEMYKVMQDKPIVIRLLDYPLHELLGDAEENMDTLTGISRLSTGELKNKVQSYKEVNPMLGHRSVRLGITNPSLFRMQIRAILSAARKYNEDCQGIDDKYVTPHIEIPLVSLPEEVKFVAKLAEKEAARLNFQRGGSSSASDNRYLLGIMYETSAACLQSEQLARVSDFGSFGTNDLTQTTKGISREDGADSFLPEYIRQGILKKDPFGTINAEGAVAKAMHIGVSSARGVRSDYEFGICGRHAGDPDSLKVCYKLGLDNVSPGPNQVPIAWLILAQESLK